MGMAGVASAMADTTRIDASKLGAAARQTLTVTANEDISNRTLRAVPLAYYSYAQTDGTNITGFDLVDAGKAGAIAERAVQGEDRHQQARQHQHRLRLQRVQPDGVGRAEPARLHEQPMGRQAPQLPRPAEARGRRHRRPRAPRSPRAPTPST